jgi:tripartite-type tricarboxylate transporter receptor subunit TctC
VVKKLNDAVAAVVADPAIQKRLIEEGSEIRTMSPAELGKFIRDENARWVKVVKDAGIKPQ